MSNIERWNTLPRVLRGGVLMALGAGAATAVAMNDSHTDPAPQHASFPVGIRCAEVPSSVQMTQNGNKFIFRCLNLQGNDVAVTAIGQFAESSAPVAYPAFYDTVVNATSPDTGQNGAVIRFDCDGELGIGTISSQTEIQPVEGNSSKTNGVGCVPQTNNNTVVR